MAYSRTFPFISMLTRWRGLIFACGATKMQQGQTTDEGLRLPMITVTAGLILCDDKVLIARRKPGDQLGRRWEFPGGKVKPEESPEECLKRELAEELDIEVEVDGFCAENVHHYEWGTVRLLGYFASWIEGDINPQVHEEITWADVEDLHNYDFLPADVPIVEELLRDRRWDLS